jgi:ribonuclease Z
MKTLALIAALAAGAAVPQIAVAESDFSVTLLGTGSPRPLPNRFSMSTLVEAGDQKLVIDAGRGATIRIYEHGLRLGEIDALFVTHFHSDHVIGIPDLWLSSWIGTPFGQRDKPLEVVGPAGTQSMMTNLREAFDDDIQIRAADEGLDPAAIELDVTEFSDNGVVYDEGGVKVRAFAVEHGDLIKPAVGYRIDYDGRSVLISGDTRYDENLIAAAEGVDLLIHEVIVPNPALHEDPVSRAIIEHHTTPQEAGQVFADVQPGLAVYSHIVLLGNRDNPPPDEEDLVTFTRETYGGPLVVGEDGMTFEITPDGVELVSE